MATNDLVSNRNMIRDDYETLPSLPTFESEPQNSFIETASACGGSIFGESIVAGSAFGSAIGHDDPTAIMGNVVRSETPDTVPSFSTANESLLQFDPDDDNIEARDPVDETCEGLRKASSVNYPRTNVVKDLKLQMNELDRTEEQWQAKMSLRTSSPTDLDANTDLYMDEVGTAEMSRTGRIQSKHFEQLGGQFIDDMSNPPTETESSFPAPTVLKDATDELSTDLSLTSSASDAGIFIKHSDGAMSQSTAIATDTEKIVRQVQQRLVGSHKKGEKWSDDREDSSIETESSFPEPTVLKDATDELSTDLSLTSSASDAGIFIKHSDGAMSQSTAIATDTEKIVRQVQQRLVGSQKKGEKWSDDGEDSSIETESSFPEPTVLKDATDELSTDLSLTSSASDTGIFIKHSDGAMSQSTAIATDTEKIVRQVQQRLVGSHKKGEKRSDDDDMAVHELTSHISNHHYGLWKQWNPVEEEGRRSKIQEGGLTSKSDISEDKDSNSKVQVVWKLLRRWVVIALALIILVAGITALGLSLPSKESTSTDRSSLPQTSPPSLRATFSPTVLLAETLTSLPPSPTQAPTTLPPPNTTSLMMRMMRMQLKLLSVSGEALFDESGPQFAAVEWLVYKDPARMELESLENESLKERYVAALLYFALGGETWFDQNDFLSSSSVCEWNSVLGMGVFCSGGVINEIAINENNLRGSLPTELAELTALKLFEMRGNGITGSIPSTLGMLPNLVTLFASNNQLTGPIPSFSGNLDMLQALSFANNQFTGNLDNFFSEDGPFLQLITVDFGNNKLNGTIPTTIGKFTSMTDLILKQNQLHGTIPLEIGTMIELDTLSLHSNNLKGKIPETIGMLENIIFLELGSNGLTGPVPGELHLLRKARVIVLGPNKLTGAVPPTLSSLKMLDKFLLHNNDLTGDLDPIFCPGGNASRPIVTFRADCALPSPEVVCSCCTSCCNHASGICGPTEV